MRTNACADAGNKQQLMSEERKVPDGTLCFSNIFYS